ncbi:MAG: hypothetical protein OXC68_01230 [Aestuariivita sp.]|nr:hypothetical protein [Aestuariivita sp.]
MMIADAFIHADNSHFGLDVCPAFKYWLAERNWEKKVVRFEEASDGLHTREYDMPAAHDNGFVPKSDETVGSTLRTVGGWNRFIPMPCGGTA